LLYFLWLYYKIIGKKLLLKKTPLPFSCGVLLIVFLVF